MPDAQKDLTEYAVFRGLLLFGAVVLATWAFGLIIWPFIEPIAWALCLSAITYKPYAYLARKSGRPRLAAGLMVLLTLVLILGPIASVVLLLVEELQQVDFTNTYKNLETHLPSLVAWSNQALDSLGLPELQDLLTQLKERMPELAPRLISGDMAETAATVLFAPFAFVFFLLIALITQYFVYREAPRLRNLVVDVSPMEVEETDRVLRTLRTTTSAAIMGGVLVALIQGALGGIAFAVAGVQSPVLWSLVMAVFSLFPFGGTALIWVPVGVYLVLTGESFGGWFIIGWGTIVVATADNLLRPWILTKTGAKDIHPLLLFFAILSGIGLFGMSGIVFGPLLLALLTTMVHIYRARYGSNPAPGTS